MAHLVVVVVNLLLLLLRLVDCPGLVVLCQIGGGRGG